MTKSCLLIVNPISGQGRGRRNAPRLRALLARSGYEVELCQTSAAGAARDLAAQAVAGEIALVLAVGGDGTFSEVVNGLGDKGVPVALFPTGTGNVLAKEYRLPRTPEKACAMILRGRTKRLDVGALAGRRFGLFAGAGFDAAVAKRLHRSRRGPITMLHYAAPILGALAAYRAADISVAVDGVPAGRAASVLVANVRSYGGPLGFVPDADPTDGLLDVCLLRGRARRDLVRYLWGGVRRRLLRYPDVTRVRGRVVELRSDDDVPVQADGDYVGDLPARIEVLPARLPLIVP